MDSETPVKTVMARLSLGAGDLVVTEAGAKIGVIRAAGLMATMATLEGGTTLALANKESLVIGGRLVTDAAAPGPCLLPPAGRPSPTSGLFTSGPPKRAKTSLSSTSTSTIRMS